MVLEYFADDDSRIHRRHRTLSDPYASHRQDPLDSLNEIAPIGLDELQPSRCLLVDLSGKLLHQQFCQFFHSSSSTLEIMRQGFCQVLELPQPCEQAALFLLDRFVQPRI